MSNTLSFQVRGADISALRREMERARVELGKTLGASLKWAAHSIAVTLGKRTIVAKGTRPVMADEADKKSAESMWDRAMGTRKFIVQDERRHPPRLVHIRARNLYEARRHPAAAVKNAGMAKAAWLWNIRKLGRADVSAKGVTASAKAKAQKHAAVSSNLKGDDPFVVMRSRVKYAEAALMNGEQSVRDAMSNAANFMAHQIDANIKKKMGAK